MSTPTEWKPVTTKVNAGEDFPTMRVHPDTPVCMLAKSLALVGLSICVEDGHLMLIETWRLNAMRNPRPAMTKERCREVEERSRS